MMVAMVFLLTPVMYLILNIVVGIVVDQIVSSINKNFSFANFIANLIKGYNRYFTLSGLAIGGVSAIVMGLLYSFGLMCV